MSGRDLLGEAEIDDNDVTTFVQHQIFGLEIAVTVVTLVQIAKRLDNASYVKSGNGIIEWRTIRAVNNGPQITTQVCVGKQVNEFVV